MSEKFINLHTVPHPFFKYDCDAPDDKANILSSLHKDQNLGALFL